MKKSSFQILTFFAICAFVVQQIAARCNVCNSNGVACISEKSFQLCFNGVSDPSQTFSCPDDTICVATQLRCAQRNSGLAPECALSTICGQCDGLNMFTCTSRSTFVQCNGTVPLNNQVGSCPKGLVCDATQAEICVSGCKAPTNPQCTNDTPL